MCTFHEDSCPSILNFLGLTGVQGPFRPRIFGFASRIVSIENNQKFATDIVRNILLDKTVVENFHLDKAGANKDKYRYNQHKVLLHSIIWFGTCKKKTLSSEMSRLFSKTKILHLVLDFTYTMNFREFFNEWLNCRQAGCDSAMTEQNLALVTLVSHCNLISVVEGTIL